MAASALILGCSERKLGDAGLLRAGERYDGPAFRLFRRFLRVSPHPEGIARPTLYVLSAEFGLVPGNHPIPWYDRRMTRQRACELRPAAVAALERVVNDHEISELYLAVGRTYLDALAGFPMTSPGLLVRIATGSSGKRLSDLHDWLHGEAPAPPVPNVDPTPTNIRFRGVCVCRDTDLALAAARAGLQENPTLATRFQGWCVEIDGIRVAPKWLVSRLTGLPVSTFHSDDARRLLAHLGLEMRRA